MRCPKCGEILEDVWIKKAGATLMGMAGGANKARPLAATRKAAKQRWKTVKKDHL